jgi:hypothetical protein
MAACIGLDRAEQPIFFQWTESILPELWSAIIYLARAGVEPDQQTLVGQYGNGPDFRINLHGDYFMIILHSAIICFNRIDSPHIRMIEYNPSYRRVLGDWTL